jgi:2-polyprenyl-3-methyl-5-hydroxy-6-metoxy-1,4-benzoquinol methylase
VEIGVGSSVLKSFIEQISARSPLQRKALQPLLATRCEHYWARGDDFLRRFSRYLKSIGLTLDDAADRYLGMCQEMLSETIHFRRTGRYTCRCQQDAYREVYSRREAMRDYMVGLAVTQFLWKNHYELYAFFLDELERRQRRARQYLEIGPGHGLHLAAALKHLAAESYQAIDISPASLQMCREILPFLSDRLPASLSLAERDAMAISPEESFDFITMGEVIEHLDDPRPVLSKVAAMLRPDGIAFLTTCANCPAKDHVYLFRDADEIRNLFQECGLVVERELCLRLNESAPTDDRELLNYAAVVRRAA